MLIKHYEMKKEKAMTLLHFALQLGLSNLLLKAIQKLMVWSQTVILDDQVVIFGIFWTAHKCFQFPFALVLYTFWYNRQIEA